MLTRRRAAKTILGALGALALPKGQTAAAIPADLSVPVVELLDDDDATMPPYPELALWGFLLLEDEKTGGRYHGEIRLTLDPSGRWELWLGRPRIEHAESAGVSLPNYSILCGGPGVDEPDSRGEFGSSNAWACLFWETVDQHTPDAG